VGSGLPKREFLFSDDAADACVYLMEKYNASEIGEFVNIGVGKEITIQELAELIADVVGFRENWCLTSQNLMARRESFSMFRDAGAWLASRNRLQEGITRLTRITGKCL